MSFGTKTAPMVFQKYNMKYFGGIQGLTIYFDDFITAVKPKDEHDKILPKVIERARKYNIKFNQKKV